MKNKYNIGDTVWFMEKNKPAREVVTGIFLPGKLNDLDQFTGPIRYLFGNFGFADIRIRDGIEEAELFLTKEDLIASL